MDIYFPIETLFGLSVCSHLSLKAVVNQEGHQRQDHASAVTVLFLNSIFSLVYRLGREWRRLKKKSRQNKDSSKLPETW